MTITKSFLKEFRSDFAHAMADLERKYGMKFELGGIRFDHATFRTRLTGVIPSVVESLAKARLEEVGKTNGTEVAIGSKFRHNSTIYTIESYKPSRPKYPFIATTQRGARYKLSLENLKRMTPVK